MKRWFMSGALLLVSYAILAPSSSVGASRSTPRPAASGPLVSGLNLTMDNNEKVVASAARTLFLKEAGSLGLIGSLGRTLYERGTASGTLNFPVEIQLTLASASHVTSTFTAKPSGGSIYGQATGSFKSIGTLGYFGGTLVITHGTGTYGHASGSVSLSGILNRRSDHLTAHVSGTLHY
jgi:hypothetical protein